MAQHLYSKQHAFLDSAVTIVLSFDKYQPVWLLVCNKLAHRDKS